MEPAIIIASIVLVVGLIWFFTHKHEKARSENFQAVAEGLGLLFHPKGDPAVVDEVGHLRLFNRGHGRVTKNMICGQTDDVDIAIFGYRFRTGSGKNQQTHQQTVISFQSTHLTLPDFELRPEHVFHKIGQAFGYQDIDFESHPTFSKRYILRGSNETAIREFFTPEILEFFESQSGISLEAANDRLIYYRARHRIKPEEVTSFMERGFEVYALLKQK